MLVNLKARIDIALKKVNVRMKAVLNRFRIDNSWSVLINSFVSGSECAIENKRHSRTVYFMIGMKKQ